MTIGSFSQCRGISLIGILGLIGLLGIVAINAEMAWFNHQMRIRVVNGIVQATHAIEHVRTNVLHRRPMDYGWRSEDHSIAGEKITISNKSGIVTVTFPDAIEGKPRDLKFVPISKGSVVTFADGRIFTGKDLAKINWFCVSHESINYFAISADDFGTLPTRFSPPECR